MTKPVTTAYLIEILQDARARTLELLQGLDHAQLLGPKLDIVNPMLWEIGHVAWFYEYFILRRLYNRPPLLPNGDVLYDSIKIAHDTRWDLPLLSLEDTLAYMAGVHDALIGCLQGTTASEADSFIYQFATFHEDMHDEAFLWTRQTLAYPEPKFALTTRGLPSDANAIPLAGDAEIPGGTFMLGSSPQAPFLFDNEKWAHPVAVAPFRISRTPVTNAEFAAFVEENGYRHRALWAPAWQDVDMQEYPLHFVYSQRSH